jgi:hypothetical protein
MGGSQKPCPTAPPVGKYPIPAQTPGSLGKNDHGDPNVTTRLGDTPGPVGVKDGADPTLPTLSAHNAGPASKTKGGTAVAVGMDHSTLKPGIYLLLQARKDDPGKWITIQSFHWEKGTNLTGGTGAGRDEPLQKRDLELAASQDSGASDLFAPANQTRVWSGKLSWVGTDGTSTLEIEFTGALVTHLNMGAGRGGDGSTISFGLSLGTLKFRYPQSENMPGAYDMGPP